MLMWLLTSTLSLHAMLWLCSMWITWHRPTHSSEHESTMLCAASERYKMICIARNVRMVGPEPSELIKTYNQAVSVYLFNFRCSCGFHRLARSSMSVHCICGSVSRLVVRNYVHIFVFFFFKFHPIENSTRSSRKPSEIYIFIYISLSCTAFY